MSSAAYAFAAFDALPAHVAVLDNRGVIVFTNLAWRLFGEENGLLSDPVGTDYFAACHGSMDGNSAAAGLREVLDGEQDQFIYEYPCHSPTDRRWFSMRASAFEAEGDQHVLVMHVDITERKLSEITITEQVERLELVTDMLSNEVSDPLDRVIRVLSNRSEQEDISTVLLALAKIQSTIDDAVEFSDGGRVAHTEMVELRTAAEAAWEARPRDGNLVVSDTRPIHANPTLLESMLGTIYDAAHERGGSDVVITVAPTRDGFTVSDTGPVVSDDDHSALFQRMGEGSTSLIAVHHLCLAHGWTIGVLQGRPAGVVIGGV